MPQTLEELYLHELQDLYDAERQITEALPQVMQAVSSPDLRQAFERHLMETREQMNRLDQIFQMMGQNSQGKPCVGVQGLIQEAQQKVQEGGDPEVLQAALIGAAQKVEHYEIAGYGTARTWARQLGHHDHADILQMTLNEEGNTDKILTQIAESFINEEAARQGGQQMAA